MRADLAHNVSTRSITLTVRQRAWQYPQPKTNEGMNMAECLHCKCAGGNMRKCTKCGAVYCVDCANRGRGPYPKVPANQCPHCGAMNASKAP